MSGCQGLEGGGGGEGKGEPVGAGDEKVLESRVGDTCTTACMY